MLASHAANGAGVTITGAYPVVLPCGAAPLRCYRRIFYLAFPETALADRVLVADDAQLHASFDALEFDALASLETELPVVLSRDDRGAVLMRLDASRSVTSIGFLSALHLEEEATLTIRALPRCDGGDAGARSMRFEDGTAILESALSAHCFELTLAVSGSTIEPLDPSSIVSVRGSSSPDACVTMLDETTAGIDLGEPRRTTSVRFAADSALPTGCALELYRVDCDRPALAPTVIAPIAEQLAVIESDFVDRRLALRVRNGEGACVAASGWSVAAVTVLGAPASPRISIASLDELAPDAANGRNALPSFWQQSGQAARPSAEGIVADAGFRDALQRFLDRALERRRSGGVEDGSRPDGGITAALVFESDAPCALFIGALGVHYSLESRHFARGFEKQVLRLGSAKASLDLALPPRCRLIAATVEVLEDFGRGEVRAAGHDPSPAGPAGEKRGAFLGDGRGAACRVAPPADAAIMGVRLAISTLSAGARVRVRLLEDRSGSPSGPVLAEAVTATGAPGASRWVACSFESSIRPAAQSAWLLVTGVEGAALWLATERAETLRLLGADAEREIGRVDGAAALYEWLVTSLAEVDRNAASPLRLSVGEQNIASEITDSRTRRFDFAAALEAVLRSAPGDEPAVSVPLVFGASLPGIATVYPPRIEYFTQA